MLIIDKEFQELIPPLTADEYAGLEESIIQDGCRDALVVWGNILVDGHNRYKICTELDIPYETVNKDFNDRDEAIIWIIKNQFGRRNLPAYERARLALRLKPVLASKAKERMVAGKANPEQKSAQGKTNDELAKAAGLSHDTIAKVAVIEDKATDDIKEKLRAGNMSINEAYNKIRLDEKKQEILEAEQSITKKADEDYKPVLFVGDSIKYTPTEKYDLLLTDPPYSTDVDNIEQFVADWLYNALDNVKDTGFAYIFIGAYPEETRAYLNARIPEHIKLEQLLVWTYKNTLGNNPSDRYKLNYQFCLFYRGENAPNLDCPLTSEQWAVQEINAPDGRQGDRYHAWQKPMEIAERFIRHSTKPGMTVYDPFACTGTFLLAAAKLGRKSYGFEINEENAAIAFRRGCSHE